MENDTSVRRSTGIDPPSKDAQITHHCFTYSRSALLIPSYIKEPRHAYCNGEKDFIICRSYNVCTTFTRVTRERLELILIGQIQN